MDKTTAVIRTLDLDFLKKYLEQVKPDLNEALFAAACWGFTDAVKLLLSDDRVDPSAWHNQALYNAAERGHLEIVELLLADARVHPSAQNNQALRFAFENGHSEIVKLIDSHPRFRPFPALDEAGYGGFTDAIDAVKPYLSDEGLIDSSASRKGHLEIVKLLLADDRVDSSAQDNSALVYALENGHSEMVKLLEAQVVKWMISKCQNSNLDGQNSNLDGQNSNLDSSKKKEKKRKKEKKNRKKKR
jgi:ankyrin repeat protein